jgi:glycerol kinase
MLELTELSGGGILAQNPPGVFDWLPKGEGRLWDTYLRWTRERRVPGRFSLTRPATIAATAQHEFEQFYPQAGWVEHDPTEILTSQLSCAVEVLGKAGARPRDVAAIGITNQRETVIVWERATGKAIHPAIVWQDRRTAARCSALEESGVEESVSSNRPGWCWTPISRPPRWRGFWTT